MRSRMSGGEGACATGKLTYYELSTRKGRTVQGLDWALSVGLGVRDTSRCLIHVQVEVQVFEFKLQSHCLQPGSVDS